MLIRASDAELLGLVTNLLSPDGLNVGLGFAVDSETVQRAIKEILPSFVMRLDPQF